MTPWGNCGVIHRKNGGIIHGGNHGIIHRGNHGIIHGDNCGLYHIENLRIIHGVDSGIIHEVDHGIIHGGNCGIIRSVAWCGRCIKIIGQVEKTVAICLHLLPHFPGDRISPRMDVEVRVHY